MNKTERRRKVANLLKEEELSSKEIAEKLGIETNLVSPIISELKKQGKIHSISPRKFVWGIRHENGRNEFLINKNEWVELEDYKLKVFYKSAYTFFGYSENGDEYYEKHSVFEFYRDNQLLIPIDLLWPDDEKGKEKEAMIEVNSREKVFKIILKYTVVSSKSIKLKIKYERTEIKLTENEKNAMQEQEED